VIRKSRAADLNDANKAAFASGDAIIIADTTGELSGFYSRADLAVVGKTFLDSNPGGQNMIEPCLYGCAVITGPHTENFRPVMSDLLDSEALVQVSGADGMIAQLAMWLENESLFRRQRERAAGAVAARTGTVQRCAKQICATLNAQKGKSHENG
jgi:3-deoxy-D-manno-octulosonic-acid transferase